MVYMVRLSAFFSSRSGFTLIELLVVISITVLLVGGGIAAYQRFNEKQIVISAAKDIVSMIRQAQRKTFAGDKPTSDQPSKDCSTTTLDGYKAQGDNSSGTPTVTLYALCLGKPDILVSSESFSGVTISPSNFYVQITNLGNSTTTSGGNPTVTISTSLFSATLTLTATGEIIQSGP